MSRMIRPTVKTPHTVASPSSKGVHVQVIAPPRQIASLFGTLRVPYAAPHLPHLKFRRALTEIIIAPLGKPCRGIGIGTGPTPSPNGTCDSRGLEASNS